MRKLVKGSAMLTAVSLGEILMRFVRTKCIALVLGPAGTGFLAQLMIFFEMLRVWGDLGARRGVIKQIAEQRQAGRDSARYGEIVKTSYFLAVTASGITALAVTVFSRFISQHLYGTPEHYPFIIFVALLLPIASVSTVTASIVKGNLEYTHFAKYTVAAYLAVIVSTPLFIYFMHYWGAVLVQAFFFIFPLLSYLLFNSRKKFISFSKNINRGALKEQLSYGAVQVYQDSLMNLSRLAAAAWIVRRMGLTEMGLYQVVVTFSTIYLAIPIQAMSGYTLPIIAAAENSKEISQAINDSLRYFLFLLTPVIVAVMLLSNIVIPLFFSADFLAAAVPLQIQLLGTFFLVMAFPFGVAMQARGKLLALFIISTVNPLLYVAFVACFAGSMGLSGVSMAFTVANFFTLLILYYLGWRYFGFRVLPKNIRLLIASAAWVALAYGIGAMSWKIRLAGLALAAPWFLLSSKDHERSFLKKKLIHFFMFKPAKPDSHDSTLSK